VSVVQLYAGAFFPGLMLAGLYIVYVIVLAKLKPHLMPPLSAQDRFVPLPPLTQKISETVSNTALPALLKALKGQRNADVPAGYLMRQLGVALMPAAFFLLVLAGSWHLNTRPVEAQAVAAAPAGGGVAVPAGAATEAPSSGGGVQEPPGATGCRVWCQGATRL
jgi:TRAP-type mannitol/chloroaromatic compound transport system permease large subunit